VSVRESFGARVAEIAPSSWFGALCRNLLVVAADEIAKQNGEEERNLLKDAVAAYRSALGAKTKAPVAWAQTGYDLGTAL
jgi:hypothetical protein